MTGPSSERTADALKVVEGLELLFRVSRFHNLPTDVAEQGFAALDRLVACNQQLQEALAYEFRCAAETIEFLHSCLTDERFEYGFPEQTLSRLERLQALAKDAPRCNAQGARHVPGVVCPVHNDEFQAALASVREAKDETEGTL